MSELTEVVDEVKRVTERLFAERDKALALLAAAEAREAALREALAFYAAPDHWQPQGTQPNNFGVCEAVSTDCYDDNGDTAREALDRIAPRAKIPGQFRA